LYKTLYNPPKTYVFDILYIINIYKSYIL